MWFQLAWWRNSISLPWLTPIHTTSNGSIKAKAYKLSLDELCCDIIPMDACHILLGRPQLFDRKVVHDGHPGTYTFCNGWEEDHPSPLSPSRQRKHK